MTLEIDPWSLLAAAFLYFLALLTAVNFRRTVRGIRRYYNNMREITWGPRWLRWQFRPTDEQAKLVAWLTIPFCLVFGTVFLLIAIIN